MPISGKLRKLTSNRGRAELALAVAKRLDPSVLPKPSAPRPVQAAKAAQPKKAAPPTLVEAATSAPGSRLASNFFDGYPRFYETSETSPYRGRLNLRYEAIFAENRDLFEGKRVLDIASHDGRWSFAALSVGAAHVTGIEGRPELVAAAEDNMKAYDISPDRYSFRAADIFAALADDDQHFDVVMCLGFLYHTLRYNELLFRIAQTGPEYVIVDTEVYPGEGTPLIHVRTEPVERQGNAVADDLTSGDHVLSGRPNITGLRRMLAAYNYPVVRTSDWGGLIRDNPGADGLGDYAQRKRVTVVGRRAEAGQSTFD